MENTNTVMGTMEHHITVFGHQRHYIITTTPTTSHPDNLNLVVSALLSAWVPMRKWYANLIAPKYSLVGDQLMSYQFYNLLTTKINTNLHTYKRAQAGSPVIENNIELKRLAPGTQRFAHSRP